MHRLQQLELAAWARYVNAHSVPLTKFKLVLQRMTALSDRVINGLHLG